jgi:primosomal protein N' (replication factor Y) (superfamily II helicase)
LLAQLGRAGGLYTYGVPSGLISLVQPGSLVRAPFRAARLQGIVWSLETESDLPKLRLIEELLDPVPVVTSAQISLAQWISTYYSAPLSDVLGAMLPPGLGRKTVYVLEPGKEPEGSRLTPDQRAIFQFVHSAGKIGLQDVQKQFPLLDVDRDVTSLVRRSLLVRTSELAAPLVSARRVKMACITLEGQSALGPDGPLQRAPKQRFVLSHLSDHGPMGAPDLSRLIPGSLSILSTLEKKGLVTVKQVETSRRSVAERQAYPETSPLTLSGAQKLALDHIVRSIAADRPGVFLLHGVTGSGKTEVYLQAIAQTIGRGRQAIMMVPEISLTPQAIERVAGRFPGRVAVLHSKLSAGERLEEWQRIRCGSADIIVGPRSAIFAPVQSLGLVIVDEEHDSSYKQEVSPRYHARDAATILGRLTGATVVMGSATPDVSTYFAALSKRVELLELPDRPVWGSSGPSRPMPPVEVVDMRQELKSGNRSIFSQALLSALERSLSDGHQSLLFLNRRGNATVVLCRDCGFVARCPNCDTPYTYHSAATRLICHRCDKRAVPPRQCPSCRGVRIRFLGVGTQRIEEETSRLFPEARVLRWDRDVTGGKDAHERILRVFARHEADILVGTQMIAKGLDFPLVTVVGVISADTGLHLPDFRAPERSFQLLTQVAGRAGRASLPSRVIVQSYTPEHYAIDAAQHHDYRSFYRQEMSFRKTAGYPPFARLIRFVYEHLESEACQKSALKFREVLETAKQETGLDDVQIIGPAPCFVSRIKNHFYWQLLVRGVRTSAWNGDLHPLLEYVPPGWMVDVDPVDLL